MRYRLAANPSPPRRLFSISLCETLSRPTVNYANTTENVLKAMRSRVYVDAPEWCPGDELDDVLQNAARKLAAQIEPEFDLERLEDELRKFPPKKRELYTDGLQIKLDLKQHARINGFLKCENVPYKPSTDSKIGDKPRMIMARHPVFLSHLLTAMKPLEHAFYHGRWLFNRYQKHTCAKSMDPLKRMVVLMEMVKSLESPVVVGLDGSAFDAHVTPGALKAEWKFYGKVWKGAGYNPARIKELMRMGKAQLRNKAFIRTDDGIVKATVLGNRMSGDLNTGLGNSVLQSAFIAAAMKKCGVPEKHWRMLVDGDDAVLMMSGEYKWVAAQLPAIFESFSQEVKVDYVEDITPETMEKIEFCQSRPVKVGDTWRLIRSPYKVYNGYKMVNLWYRTQKEVRQFMSTVAPAELIMAAGIPVHQALFKCMHRISGDEKPAEVISRRFWLRQCLRVEALIPHTEHIALSTRRSYGLAFGVSIAQQLMIESQFEAWEMTDLPPDPTGAVSEDIA